MTADDQVTEKSLDFNNFYNTLNGKLVRSKSTHHTLNPSNLEANPEFPLATIEDVNQAVTYAKVAAKLWTITPLAQRQQAVIDFAYALRARSDEFAVMLTKEQGKPLAAAKDEIARGAHWLETQARLPFPEDLVEETEERIVRTRYVPLGVALAIVPWNYPVMLACGKIAPALVAGNVLILKPSPFTPYCGLKLAELAQQFFPPGVFQALSGDDNLGPWLTSHDGIDKVSFTGSTATGKLVMQSCSKSLKRLTLELGGNDPAIICSDVDVKDTASKLSFINSGQVCIAIKRIYVHSSIYSEFLAAMVEATKSLLVGDGFTSNVMVGPIQNPLQFDRVQGFLRDIEESKLQVAIGGSKANGNSTSIKGYFIQPTIVDNPPESSRIVKEEPFGPIVPLLQWDNEDEVIFRANDTDTGLGASVWSKDLERAQRIAIKLESGSIWINTHLEIQPNAAFGGHKKSGIGAEWGLEGLRSYCNTQTLYIPKA